MRCHCGKRASRTVSNTSGAVEEPATRTRDAVGHVHEAVLGVAGGGAGVLGRASGPAQPIYIVIDGIRRVIRRSSVVAPRIGPRVRQLRAQIRRASCAT